MLCKHGNRIPREDKAMYSYDVDNQSIKKKQQPSLAYNLTFRFK